MARKDILPFGKIEDNSIFTIVGTYGKPFLKMGDGYSNMTNGSFCEAADEDLKCRKLSEIILMDKYEEPPHWLQSWKETIINMSRIRKRNTA